MPGNDVVVQRSLNDRIKSPGTDNIVSLRANVHWEQFIHLVAVLSPASTNLRGQRTGKPCIEYIGFTIEAPWFTTL